MFLFFFVFFLFGEKEGLIFMQKCESDGGNGGLSRRAELPGRCCFTGSVTREQRWEYPWSLFEFTNSSQRGGLETMTSHCSANKQTLKSW